MLEKKKCPRCYGKGKWESDCSRCWDSTDDHYCDTTWYSCETCNRTGYIYVETK